MKKESLKQRGFTLVEILIVVVILAILASLILPRMLSQPERAVIAEAQQMLGTLRRAQQTRVDITDDQGVWLNFDCSDTTCTGGASVLGQLGIQAPKSTAKYIYSCGDSSCKATRTGSSGATYDGATVELDDEGNFACDGTLYKAASTDATKGCAI